MGRSNYLELNAADREALENLVARPSTASGHVRRARVVLLSAEGRSGKDIAKLLGFSPEYVSRVRQIFRRRGVAGLAERKRPGRKDHAVSANKVERIIQTTLSPPPPGRPRWTTRLLAHEFGLTSWTISKILRAHAIKPHLARS